MTLAQTIFHNMGGIHRNIFLGTGGSVLLLVICVGLTWTLSSAAPTASETTVLVNSTAEVQGKKLKKSFYCFIFFFNKVSWNSLRFLYTIYRHSIIATKYEGESELAYIFTGFSAFDNTSWENLFEMRLWQLREERERTKIESRCRNEIQFQFVFISRIIIMRAHIF